MCYKRSVKMTKTQLLDELSKSRKYYFTYKEIETAINKLTGYPPKRGIGMWSTALYPYHQYRVGVPDPPVNTYQSYFIRPSRGENRFLRKIGYGRYVIDYVRKNPYGTMGKTKLIDKLLATGETTFSFSDIRKAINEIRGYSEKTSIGMWSCALYGTPTRWNRSNGYFTRPTVGDSRFFKKIGYGQYTIAQ